MKVAIVEAMGWIGEPCSPVLLAAVLDEKVGDVSYHVRVLVKAGALLAVSTHQRRGALEHRYRLVRP